MKKVLLVFGTRPEAIKMAPLVQEIEDSNVLEGVVCVTGQHREMLDQVLELFGVVPDYDLNIMAHGQSIIDIITKSMHGIDKVIKKENPDIVLVHGDTSTSCAAAQIAFLNKIPVGHIEAGLRSFNNYSPFPEEMNRKITATLSNYHFAPTVGNANNLKLEGVTDNVFVTGNTVIDSLFRVIDDNYEFADQRLNSIDYDKTRVILLTCHRRENWGEIMDGIFESILQIVEENPDVIVVYPVHKNPTIRKLVDKRLLEKDRIILIEPLEYKPFANLINRSNIILTDSGGIQEEAPALGKPVLVLRTETERPEACDAGTVKVVGVIKEDIVKATTILLYNEEEYQKMSKASNPYGNGNTCKRIVEVLSQN